MHRDFFGILYHCLDEEFDAPDAEADYQLCCTLAAGKVGLHPDAWGDHDPLTTPPPHHRRHARPRAVEVVPVDPVWAGEVELTCDDCARPRFPRTLRYVSGKRPAAVEIIRALGHAVGWTCIGGRDRCPLCSQMPTPQGKGNGAGTGQGHEQHA
jgi:hypothetical protein